MSYVRANQLPDGSWETGRGAEAAHNVGLETAGWQVTCDGCEAVTWELNMFGCETPGWLNVPENEAVGLPNRDFCLACLDAPIPDAPVTLTLRRVFEIYGLKVPPPPPPPPD